MATKGTALVAFWDGESRGTAHMIKTARRHGLEVAVHKYNPLADEYGVSQEDLPHVLSYSPDRKLF